MERRDVLKALLAIPAVKSIEVANVRLADVIVLEYDGHLSDSMQDRLHQQLKTVWPDNKIVVLDGTARIRIARQES